MKTGIIKLLGACAAAFALAQPASATVTIGLQVVGQDLQVFANRGSDVITGFDIGINFNSTLFGNISGATDSGVLGDSTADALFDFNKAFAPGVMEVFETSFLSNALVGALQTTDSITLFTVHFDGAADLSKGNFSLVPFAGLFAVDCASGATGTVVCVPGAVTAVPEPSSMALVTLGLALVGIRSRRRSASKPATAMA